MKKIRLKLTGKKFNRLLVLGFSHINKHKQAMWKCRCDCGKTTFVVGGQLKTGHTKSCGCYNSERLGALNRLSRGEAAFNVLFSAYKRSARVRGHSFQLSQELFRKLTQQVCHYCGQAPSKVHKPSHCNGMYVYNGIDRVDNSKGYVRGNVVACCVVCNRWKQARSQEKFLEQVKKIYEHSVMEN